MIVNTCADEWLIPPLAVPPLSYSVAETVTTPKAFKVGVKLKVPPALIAGWTLNSALLLLVTVKLTLWPASLGGPGEMPVAQLVRLTGPQFSFTLTSGPLVKLGGWLTQVTVITKVCAALVSWPPLAVPPLS